MPEVIFPGPEGRLEGRYHPQKAIRSMVERVVRVAYRDACIEAEKTLQKELGVAQAPPSPPQTQQAHSPAAPNSNSKSNRPDDNISTIAELARWSFCSISGGHSFLSK